jgi:hypothetical protein
MGVALSVSVNDEWRCFVEKRFARTLVILTCGIAMALVAYAGQVGYKEEDLSQSFRMPRGESIRVSLQKGVSLDYRLLTPPTSFPAQAPELILYVSCDRPGLIDGASVVYRISGPCGSELQAQALPVRGGYQADIYFSVPGRYQVATEIQTSRGTLNDRFDYEIL